MSHAGYWREHMRRTVLFHAGLADRTPHRMLHLPRNRSPTTPEGIGHADNPDSKARFVFRCAGMARTSDRCARRSRNSMLKAIRSTGLVSTKATSDHGWRCRPIRSSASGIGMESESGNRAGGLAACFGTSSIAGPVGAPGMRPDSFLRNGRACEG